MHFSDVPVVLMDLPTSVHGFICLGEDYNPCIVINTRITKELQEEAYKHELKHLENGDMDNESYDEYGAYRTAI